jgi:hypothetical protein
MTSINSHRDLETFMQVAQDVAIAKAKLMPTTPDIRRRAAALVAFGRDKIAEMRRTELAQRRSNVVSGTIRGWIQKLVHSELVAEIKERSAANPNLALAFRECDSMPDDDLKSLLEDIVALSDPTE